MSQERDPAVTDGDDHTKYRFFPTVRRGYRPSEAFAKSDLGDGKLETQGQTTVEYTAAVTEGPDAGTETTEPVDLSMYGPGHVTGIDEGQVVRMEPEPGSSTTPPNYFPFVEFETPDLPWLFSPVKADDQGRSYPWLTLVAVEKEKASLSQASKGPNPVLEAPEEEFPPVEDAWAWAHAQVTGDPGQQHGDAEDALTETFSSRSNATVSRLLCPRNLDPSTSYVAAVVPTFEAGRKVGLGEDPPGESESDPPTMEFADFSKRLPVYHSWEFTTSEKGDFEYLVRQLESRDLASDEYSIGYREIDVTDPGPENLDFDDGETHTVRLGGALQAAQCDDWWWYEHSDELRTLLNKPATAVGDASDSYEIVGPPIYGQWHSQEIFEDRENQGDGFLDLTPGESFAWSDLGDVSGMAWCDGGVDASTVEQRYDGYGPVKPLLAPGPEYQEGKPYGEYDEWDLRWLYDLNLTPSFRIPAAVGGKVVQDHQENLMTSAWEQVGDVREANRRLAAAQLSRGAMAKTVERLSAPGYATEKLLQVTRPAQDRIYLDGEGTTAAEHLAAAPFPDAVLSAAFRRLTSPAGRLSQRIETDASGEGIVSGLLDGSLSTTVDDGPDGMVSVEEGPDVLDGLCRDVNELGDPEDRREPSPEERAEREADDGEGEQSSAAAERLRSMREDAESVLGTLDRMRDVVAGQPPTARSVAEVRRLADDAVGAWHALDARVANFGRVLAALSARRQSLPAVPDSFDRTTRVELSEAMTRPFREPFLPSVSDSILWPDGLRNFSGPAFEEAFPPDEYPPGPRLPEDVLATGDEFDGDAAERDDDEAAAGESQDGDASASESSDGDGNGDADLTYPVTVAEIRSARDSVETLRAALDDGLAHLGEGGSDAGYLVRLFCGRSFETPETEVELDPAAVEHSWEPIESFVDRIDERLGGPGLRRRSDPLDTIMAYPEFPQPMYRDLKDVSEDYILPGVEQVPKDTVGALMTNRRFVEAYMAGLNHEMASELLWRNYPTDRAGSYFKRFWDQRSRIPKPTDDDKLDDIIPLHRWDDKGSGNAGNSPLGSNVRTGETDDDSPPDERNFGGDDPEPDSISPTVVLLIRGELLQRYPNTTIYAAKARNVDDDREPEWASADEKAAEKDTAAQKFPIFRGRLDPDITFLGFDLTVEEALHDPYHRDDTADPDGHADEGWFFVLSEPPGETRFGMDIGQGDEADPPFGVSEGSGNDPTNRATEGQVNQGVERGWAGLSWKHLPTGDGGDVTHVDVDGHAPGTDGQEWTVEAGDTWAEPAAWSGDEDRAEFEFDHEQAATWGKNSAHMAYITWQKPVRIAIHADDILPGENQ